jgi:hypothetical protein
MRMPADPALIRAYVERFFVTLSGNITRPSFHLSGEEIKLADEALQLAWNRFLKTGMIDQHNVAEAQRVIAQRIMCSAAEGKRDPWLLARDALFHLWAGHVHG